MGAFYNEIDPYAAQWLRNLIEAGHIAPGVVDERSIVELDPDELRGYTQCHFFAGIGGWSYALRLAGWPDDRPVWTGSCPCQPFSAAGKQRGSEDERHLWPAFFRLIRECRPGIVVGEQVAGSAGYAWWDHVAADLEGEGYAAAAADIGAHSVGAPHIRQRLYWVAHGDGAGLLQRQPNCESHESEQPASRRADAVGCGADGIVADADGRHSSAEGLQRGGEHRQQPQDGGVGILAHNSIARLEGGQRARQRTDAQRAPAEQGGEAGKLADASGASLWSDVEWLPCRDGKARPVEPGTFPLAHGIPNRVGRLRAYGNAIVPQVAAAFLRAAL